MLGPSHTLHPVQLLMQLSAHVHLQEEGSTTHSTHLTTNLYYFFIFLTSNFVTEKTPLLSLWQQIASKMTTISVAWNNLWTTCNYFTSYDLHAIHVCKMLQVVPALVWLCNYVVWAEHVWLAWLFMYMCSFLQNDKFCLRRNTTTGKSYDICLQ